MDIIVHYPRIEEAENALKKEKAIVHADLVSYFIHNLSCSEEQKCDLLNSYIPQSKKNTYIK